ncbi:hypothetical protein D3C75_1175060 [compost metagenome]
MPKENSNVSRLGATLSNISWTFIDCSPTAITKGVDILTVVAISDPSTITPTTLATFEMR